MTKTITVEGDITAVDTATNLITQGSVATPDVIVPAGKSKITRIVAAVAQDAAAAGSAVYFVRLGGTGVLNGEQTLVIAAAGIIAVQAGSDQAPASMQPVLHEDLDIEVRALDSIRVQGEMAGSDLGTARMAVTLVFD